MKTWYHKTVFFADNYIYLAPGPGFPPDCDPGPVSLYADGGDWTVPANALAEPAMPILLGCGVLVAYGRELNALAAGPEVAASLGGLTSE